MADDTGVMKATFFNQPWLVQKYPAGTRLVLHGKFEARNRFRVQAHAPTARGDHGRPTRWRTTRPPRACPRPRSSPWCARHADRVADVPEPLPGPTCAPSSGCPIARPRWPPPTSPAPTPTGAVAPAPRLRRAAARAARAAAPAAHAPRSRDAAPVLDGPPELTARWLTTLLPFAPTGDQRARARRRSTTTWLSRGRCSGCSWGRWGRGRRWSRCTRCCGRSSRATRGR